MTLAPETAPVAGGEAGSADDGGAPKPGMIKQLRGLYVDGRELVDAEIGFQKARAAAAGRQIRAMAVLAIVGLILVGCALMALVIGTMIALIPVLGAWGAMGATVVASLALTALCFWLAAGRVTKVGALFASDPEPEPESLKPGSGGNP